MNRVLKRVDKIVAPVIVLIYTIYDNRSIY